MPKSLGERPYGVDGINAAKRCMSAKCETEPEKDGECWMCPKCVEELEKKGGVPR